MDQDEGVGAGQADVVVVVTGDREVEHRLRLAMIRHDFRHRQRLAFRSEQHIAGGQLAGRRPASQWRKSVVVARQHEEVVPRSGLQARLADSDAQQTLRPVAIRPDHLAGNVHGFAGQRFGRQCFGRQRFGRQCFGRQCFGRQCFGRQCFGDVLRTATGGNGRRHGVPGSPLQVRRRNDVTDADAFDRFASPVRQQHFRSGRKAVLLDRGSAHRGIQHDAGPARPITGGGDLRNRSGLDAAPADRGGIIGR